MPVQKYQKMLAEVEPNQELRTSKLQKHKFVAFGSEQAAQNSNQVCNLWDSQMEVWLYINKMITV